MIEFNTWENVYAIMLSMKGSEFMKVKVGVSNHHVHLNEQDYHLLFGNDEFTKKVDLNQPGEFASMQVVTIKGNNTSHSPGMMSGQVSTE